MYSNMPNIRNYSSMSSSYPASSFGYSSNFAPRFSNSSSSFVNSDSNRIVAGGFLGPFLLGGITGGLLAPAFYPRPYYYPYPYYGPYYR